MTKRPLPTGLRVVMSLTDFGFLLYWSVTALVAAGWLDLPPEWMFKDYSDPRVIAWNWSFAPLDLLASGTGLYALRLAGTGRAWRSMALISAALTFCAGFMAVSYWAITRDFDPAWWAPNLFLMVWPVAYRSVLISRA